MRMIMLRGLALLATVLASAPVMAASECHGRVGDGRLEDGVQLPTSGSNYSAYSMLAGPLGRTWVHSTVAGIVTDAYAELAAAHPDWRYVYGETGGRNGGVFKPHKTHRNGLSVDFFMPVRDRDGRSVALPTGIGNRYGYDLEFDANARMGDYAIDFDAIAEHLYQLQVAATARAAGIAQVIIDPRYFPKLFATSRGRWLEQNLRFMKRNAWVRHDEHYHVDFAVRCKPLTAR